MTRKDYVMLAAALHPTNTQPCYSEGREQHKADCEAIADALAKNDPRFDRERFLKACGVQL